MRGGGRDRVAERGPPGDVPIVPSMGVSSTQYRIWTLPCAGVKQPAAPRQSCLSGSQDRFNL